MEVSFKIAIDAVCVVYVQAEGKDISQLIPRSSKTTQ